MSLWATMSEHMRWQGEGDLRWVRGCRRWMTIRTNRGPSAQVSFGVRGYCCTGFQDPGDPTEHMR